MYLYLLIKSRSKTDKKVLGLLFGLLKRSFLNANLVNERALIKNKSTGLFIHDDNIVFFCVKVKCFSAKTSFEPTQLRLILTILFVHDLTLKSEKFFLTEPLKRFDLDIEVPNIKHFDVGVGIIPEEDFNKTFLRPKDKRL
jgi:hypothetical protein